MTRFNCDNCQSVQKIWGRSKTS